MKAKCLIPMLTLTCLLATPALAQVNYAVSGGSAYVTSSPNASGNIVIASTYQGKPVTSIGYDAFYYCTSLTSVTIPNSVTYIGERAFSDCASLTSVTIPNSVTGIGLWAFSDCTNLTTVTIGSSVTSIGDGAFMDCTSLTNVTIPNSVTYIGEGAFSDCTSLTNFSVDAANAVYSSLDGVLFNKAQTTLILFPAGRGGGYAIPNTVTNIGDHSFYHCTSLTSVTIGSSVTSIGYYSFEHCTSLTSVTIGSSVTSIGEAAFSGCTSLTSVTIGSSVTDIGYDAFSYCTSLTTVTIGSSVTSIGYAAFSYCTSLTSVTIGSSVASLGGWAFNSCTGLTSVTIPNSVTNIGDDAFYDCTSLTSVTFLGNAPSEGAVMFGNVALGAKVYYYYGTTGWGPTYGGLPTLMLGAPAPQVAAASVGVKPGGFGFTLNGVVHQTIVIEASTNLGNPVWIPVGTNTLTGRSSYFSDPEWTNHPARFYRAVTP